LIGFWYDDDAKASAGKKAFIVNRIGDFGFILGIFTLFAATGRFDFDGIAAGADRLATMTAGGTSLTLAFVGALLLFLGAVGKSAQLPLYVWLPDAMAGPTPVSALIHAATMVTAGVYMVARMNFLYVLAPGAMLIVCVVGVLTALFAGAIAVAQNDIKKVLAYSTVSQLGFMFAAVGAGAFWVAIFHVLTHAFFKACLFLGSGSVIHAMGGEQDIRKMGGLKKWMPVTRWTFLVATLAIAGVPGLAGFFSKDEILWSVFSNTPLDPEVGRWLPQALWLGLLIAAATTAFYMARLYMRTFEGPFRGDAHTAEHLHESPGVMTWPLVLLAAGAVCVGWLGMGDVFLDTFAGTHHGVLDLGGGTRYQFNPLRFWLDPVFRDSAAAVVSRIPEGPGHASTEWMLVAASVLAAFAGLFLGWDWYRGGKEPRTTVPGLLKWAQDKFYVDELYDLVVVRPLRAVAEFLHVVVDEGIIDTLLVRGAAWLFEALGWVLRRLQNGQVQFYAFVLVLGLAAMMAFFLG
jgi:NADH-quinone oxidoreductase subunit L